MGGPRSGEGRPPASARELCAYRCGQRIAEWNNPRAVDAVNKGHDLGSWFTRDEMMVMAHTPPRVWWRWWWKGFRSWGRADGK